MNRQAGLDGAVVALTNAVHPVRRAGQLIALRQNLHRAARAAVRPREPASATARAREEPA